MLYTWTQPSTTIIAPPKLHCGTLNKVTASLVLFTLVFQPFDIFVKSYLLITGIVCSSPDCTIGLYSDDAITTCR